MTSNKIATIGRAVLALLTVAGASRMLPADPPDPKIDAPYLSAPLEEDLNPAFRLSPEDVAAAMKKGIDAFNHNKTKDDIVERYKKEPHLLHGRSEGHTDNSYVICASLEGLDIIERAYDAARLYEKDTISQQGKDHGEYLNGMYFVVYLQSAPSMKKTPSDADVNVDKFILSDDLGNMVTAQSGSTTGRSQSGDVTFSGVNESSHPETSMVYGNYTYNVADVNGNVSQVTGYGWKSVTTQEIDYEPWSESRPYYSCLYHVGFPLFDADRFPLISPKAKKLTLHIITKDSELITTYDLATGDAKTSQPAVRRSPSGKGGGS